MIEVERVSFAYAENRVLAKLSLTAATGEVIAVLGGSGEGKSTLLNLVAGLLEPSGGSVRVDGLLPEDAARQQRIGYVFQKATLLPYLTVMENVCLPLEFKVAELGRSEITRRANEALELARIRAAADRHPHELSGGMQTRAALARAFAMRPKAMLLDEPFQGLDDFVKEKILSDLQHVLSQYATVLVTHSLLEATILADRVLVMGTISSEGTGSSIVGEIRIEVPRPRTVDMISEDLAGPLRDARGLLLTYSKAV